MLTWEAVCTGLLRLYTGTASTRTGFVAYEAYHLLVVPPRRQYEHRRNVGQTSVLTGLIGSYAPESALMQLVAFTLQFYL